MATDKYPYYCSVLGVTTHVSFPELKRSYISLMMQWHPDRHYNDRNMYDIANEKAKNLNEAYEYLSEILENNDGKFNKYDVTTSARHNGYKTQRKYQGKYYESGFPDNTVTEIFVKSSNIVSIGYNVTLKILYIKFTSGAVYRYYCVPKKIFDELFSAPSHGKYAHSKIYQNYQYERC